MLISSVSFAQKVSVPHLSLTGVDFNIKVTSLPDSISKIPLKFVSASHTFNFVLYKNGSKVDTNIAVGMSGNYKVFLSSERESISEVRVIPGWLSIIPPLIAILLALFLRQVLVSLAAGIYVGAIFL